MFSSAGSSCIGNHLPFWYTLIPCEKVASVINCYIENLSAKRILVLILIPKMFRKSRTEKVILAHAYHLTMLSEYITVVFLFEVHIFTIFWPILCSFVPGHLFSVYRLKKL
jgi:hypothetical protein